uniref:Uncharacterized protein n=1 Tax=Ditylenchus dipsaci TaxID=166011 RepID=A0A915E3M0_9BILA
MEKTFEPLTNWLKDAGLKDKIEKAVVSQRLTSSPSALVASSYGWSGNMERICQARDPTQEFYANQKKTFEINPRHPVIKELLKRVEADKEDPIAASTAQLLFETATLRSGFSLQDQVGFASRIENLIEMKETGNAILSSTEMDLKNVNIICDEKLNFKVAFRFPATRSSRVFGLTTIKSPTRSLIIPLSVLSTHSFYGLEWCTSTASSVQCLAAMSSLAYGLIHQQQSNPVMDYTLLNNLINHHYNTNNSVSSKSDGCENHAPADLAAEMNSVLAMHNNIALNPSFLQNSNLFALVSLLICIYHILYIFKSISISGQSSIQSQKKIPRVNLRVRRSQSLEPSAIPPKSVFNVRFLAAGIPIPHYCSRIKSFSIHQTNDYVVPPPKPLPQILRSPGAPSGRRSCAAAEFMAGGPPAGLVPGSSGSFCYDLAAAAALVNGASNPATGYNYYYDPMSHYYSPGSSYGAPSTTHYGFEGQYTTLFMRHPLQL